MFRKLFFLFCCLNCVCIFNSIAQEVTDFADYKTRYKENDLVYLKVKVEITIKSGKSNLDIEDHIYEETYYNNFKAGAFAENDIRSSDFMKLKNIEASTLIPDKSKFKEVRVKEFKTKDILSDDIFYDDIKSSTYTYPSLHEGCISKLNYTLSLTDPHIMPSQFIQRFYPIEDYEFIINTDKNVDIGIKYYNTDSLNYQYDKQEKGNRLQMRNIK